VTAALFFIAGIIGWGVSGSYDFLVCSLFLPFIFAFGLTAYASWVRNDYTMLLNIKEHNIKL
jgi:hypothetical protein